MKGLRKSKMRLLETKPKLIRLFHIVMFFYYNKHKSCCSIFIMQVWPWIRKMHECIEVGMNMEIIFKLSIFLAFGFMDMVYTILECRIETFLMLFEVLIATIILLLWHTLQWQKLGLSMFWYDTCQVQLPT